MREPISWDSLCIQMVSLVAQRSRDPRTRIGAILLSPDRRHLGWGWNSFVSGLEENDDRWRVPNKYPYILHAEAGAIIHSKQDLTGWDLYLSMPPCPECTKLIIASKIKRIVYLNQPSSDYFDYEISYKLLKEAGVELIQYKGE